MTELKKELEDERRKKGVDSGNFEEKQNRLIRELELIKATTEVIEAKNKQLAEENNRLKLEFKSQENDRELLLRQLVAKKKENVELKEEMGRMKDEV